MEDLKRKIDACTRCGVSEEKVSFYGNIHAQILFLAQNPGPRPGYVPFSLDDWSRPDNASGDIFRNMCREIKLRMKDFGITNLVKCRVSMTQAHIRNCFYWLYKEMQLMTNLSLIVCLGRPSGDFFDIEDFGVVREIGKDLLGLLIYHPGFVLRQRNRMTDYRKQFRLIRKVT